MDTASRTKKHLSDSLKSLSAIMPLSKITVKDLCNHSNVNRGTFYYHFKDIFDLINWTYHTQITLPAREIMNSYAFPDMPSVTSFILGKLYQDKDFYIQVMNHEDKNLIEATMLEDSEGNWKLLWKKALQYAGKPDASFESVSCANKEYLLEYFVRGHYYATQHWIRDGMQLKPDELGKILDDASLRGLITIWSDIIAKG